MKIDLVRGSKLPTTIGQLSNIDGSNDGTTPNQYSIEEGLDAIPHDNYGYAEVGVAKLKARNVEKQPSTS